MEQRKAFWLVEEEKGGIMKSLEERRTELSKLIDIISEEKRLARIYKILR